MNLGTAAAREVTRFRWRTLRRSGSNAQIVLDALHKAVVFRQDGVVQDDPLLSQMN
ncbi:hypothetical protein [Trinickia sp.]|uniref:hypothetical protein n=1 Tax=Trinickia sp. TaxID=2571163 RepID=UPI003F80699B